MTKSASRFLTLYLTLLTAFTCLPVTLQAQTDYEKLLAEKSPALVAVKYLLKFSMPGMDAQESEAEANGVMIDPKGIILCSNTRMGGIMAMMQRMMGGGDDRMDDMSAVPTDIKVLIGDDTEGLPAKLVARDSELDLAWVQIKDPKDKKFDALDISVADIPKIGQELILVERLPKHHDRIPVFNETKLAGIAKKPRELFIPAHGISSYGDPIFTTSGKLVGFTALQLPDRDSAGGPMAMMTEMFDMQRSMGALILPAAEVAKATKLALDEGSSAAEAAKPEKDAAPKDKEK